MVYYGKIVRALIYFIIKKALTYCIDIIHKTIWWLYSHSKLRSGMDKIVGDDAVVHSFALLSTYGDVVTSSQLSASEGDVIFDVTVAKVAASMVGMMDR